MAKRNTKSYSKFTYDDLKNLGLSTIVVDLFANITIPPVPPSAWLIETLRKGDKFSLNTEKAKSEFIIAPILNELHTNNEEVFAVYSGFSFNVDPAKGLQGFCDFLLAKPPLNIVPDSPIIAVVEAKLNDVITAAVPQCAAEMYATRLWNEKYNQPPQTVYGIITTGNLWLFLRLKADMTIEIDRHSYPLQQLETVLGVWQHIINQFKI
ncbi:MAG: hypothetical protein RLZZ292_2537 [Bacteroidota bacterium]|jgi:hypothetical protein